MSDQIENADRPLSELASEYFGAEYKGEGAAESQPIGKSLTVEEAVEKRQEARDLAAIKEQQANATRQTEQRTPVDDAPELEQDESGIWSNEDVQSLVSLNNQIALYQQDLQAFQQLKAIGVDGLAKGDREKAVAIRAQFMRAEEELADRARALTNLAHQVEGKAAKAQTSKVHKVLKQEKDKLLKALPDFNKAPLEAYLSSLNFTKQDIASIGDHRLVVLAEKARRYDEMQNPTGKKTNLVLPKNSRKVGQSKSSVPQSELDKARDKLKKSGRIDDAVAYRTLLRRSRA